MTEPSTGTVRVEPAERGDLTSVVALMRALAELEGNGGRFATTPDQLDAALFGTAAGMACWVARSGPAVVGTAVAASSWTALTCRPTLRLVTLIVDEAWRARGLGARLLAAVAQRCAELDCGLDFMVRADNLAAQRFYAAAGGEPRTDWQTWRVPPAAIRDLVATSAPPGDARQP